MNALRQHRSEVTEKKKHSVLSAIETFLREDREITISAVSRAAGVSREFVHQHKHLHHSVKQAAKQAADRNAIPVSASASETVLTQGFRADRAILDAHIRRQRSQIAELNGRLEEFEHLRKRWLGSQLPGGQRQGIDPEVHTELRVTNDKLMSDNTFMLRQIAELRRLNDRLEGELAASRQAHAEALQGIGATYAAVNTNAWKSRK